MRRSILLNLLLFAIIGLAVPVALYYLLLMQPLTCAPDCVGINLNGRDLQGMNLAKVNFVEADLSNVNLSQANLREADLSGANLSRSNLRGADLTDAKLIGTDFSNADLTGSILNGADLSGANLQHADLTGVDLTETGVSGASFVKAILTNAQLRNANLSGINFTDANLAGANLQQARLSGASLSRADLSGVNLTQSDLTGAWLNLTNLTDAELSYTSLLGCTLIGARLASVNLTGSDLRGALAVGATFEGANLRGADLRQTRLTVAQLTVADLRLDPVLREFNQLQLANIRVDTNLNGVQYDAHTRWPTRVPLRSIAATLIDAPLPSNALTTTSSTTTTQVAVNPNGEPPANNAAARATPVAPQTPTQTQTSTAGQGPTATPSAAGPVVPTTQTNLTGTLTTGAAEANDGQEPKHVKVNFFINGIHSIDSRRGLFITDFYLDFFWDDPAQAGKDVRKVISTTLYNPKLDLVNSHNAQLVQSTYDNSAEPHTNVRLRTLLLGAFASPFNLRRFPFDKQTLSIKIESTDFDSDQLLFDFVGLTQPIVQTERPYTQTVPKGRYVDRAALNEGWRLQEAKIIQQIHVLPYDNSSWSQFRIDLIIQRVASLYIWKVLLGCVLVLVLSCGILWIDIDAVQYRLWLLVLLFVVTHAFNAVLWKMAPHVPYLTFLDYYLLFMYGALLWLAAAILLVNRFRQRGYQRLAMWFDRTIKLTYPVILLIINLGLFWTVLKS